MVCPGLPSVQGISGESGHVYGLCSRLFGAELLELTANHLRKGDALVLGRLSSLSFERLGKFDAEKGITSGRVGTLHDPIGQSWQKYETPLTCSRGSPLGVASVSM
jgi:hypothetical protein